MTKETNKVFRHVLPLQIRFNDVDKFGHVNNTVYFQLFDTAKTDYFSSVCTDIDWEQVAIVVVKIEAEFLGQVKTGCNIACRTRITRIGRTSFEFEVKSRCWSVLVLYDLIRQQSMPFPEAWRQAICQYDGLE